MDKKELALLIRNCDRDTLTWITQHLLIRRFGTVAKEMVEKFRSDGDRMVMEVQVDLPSLFTQADLLKITKQAEAKGIIEDNVHKVFLVLAKTLREELHTRFDEIWHLIIEMRKNEIRKRHEDNYKNN